MFFSLYIHKTADGSVKHPIIPSVTHVADPWFHVSISFARCSFLSLLRRYAMNQKVKYQIHETNGNDRQDLCHISTFHILQRRGRM